MMVFFKLLIPLQWLTSIAQEIPISLNIRSFHTRTVFPVILFLLFVAFHSISQQAEIKQIPFLSSEPIIDGDLSEWKQQAFSDGVWDLNRVQRSDWFEPKRNRLVVHEHEDSNALDLSSTYYMAWDGRYLYLGAEVHDNINDTMDAKHEPKRWYYKDAIAWFLEAPKDTVSESFGNGDHAFCFVIDTLMPAYGAWWRHGDEGQSYIEEPLPREAVTYAIAMNPWQRSKADYILEARVDLQATFGRGDRQWKGKAEDHTYGMMIVHCDPDGAEYGGHLLIYGKGDDDATWQPMRFKAREDE